MAKKKSLWEKIKDAFKTAASNGGQSASKSLAQQSGNTNASIKKNVQTGIKQAPKVADAYEKALQKKVFHVDPTDKESLGAKRDRNLAEQTAKARNNTLVARAQNTYKQEANKALKPNQNLQFEQKLGLNQSLKAADIKASNKVAPITSYATRKLSNALSLGGSELALRGASEPVKRAIAEVDGNLTKGQKIAGTVAEIGGMLVPYGATAKGAGMLGKALTREAGEKGALKLANTKFIKGLAEKSGKNAGELAAKVVDNLQRDLGMHLTTENLQSALMALDSDSDNKLGEYLKNQAINTAFNGVIDVAPIASAGVKAAGKELKPYAEQAGKGAYKLATSKEGAIKLGSNKGSKVLKSFDGYNLPQSAKGELETAVKEAEKLLKNGDTDLAINRIREASNVASRGARVIEPLDDTTMEIKEILRTNGIDLPTYYRSDVNKGEYEALRRRNFGKLRLTKNGTPVDDLWMYLNNKYGNMFPAEIEHPAEQLEYLADIVNKEDMVNPLPDDEAQYLAKKLQDELWSKLSGSKENIDEAYEKSMAPRGEFVSDDIARELPPQSEVDDAVLGQYAREGDAQYRKEIGIARSETKLSVLDDYIARLENTDIPFNELAYLKGVRNSIDTMISQMKIPEAGERFVEGSEKTIDQFMKIAEDTLNKNKSFIKELPSVKTETKAELPSVKAEQPRVDEPLSAAEIERSLDEYNNLSKGDKAVKEQTNDLVGLETKTKAEREETIAEYEQEYKDAYRGDGRATSKAYASMSNASSNEYERELLQEIKNEGSLSYDIITHKEAEEHLHEMIANNGINTSKKMKEIVDTGKIAEVDLEGSSANSFRQIHAEARTGVSYFASELNKAKLGGAAEQTIKQLQDDLANCMIVSMKTASQAGGTLEYQRYYSLLDGSGKARVAKNDILDVLDRNLSIRKKLGLKKGKQYAKERRKEIESAIENMPEFKGLRDALDNLSKEKDPEMVGEKFGKVVDELNKVTPMSALELFNEWRYLSMLGNVKTHERNMIGNVTFGLMRKASNSMKNRIEKAAKTRVINSIDTIEKELESGNLSAKSQKFLKNKWNITKSENGFAINGKKVSTKEIKASLNNLKSDAEFMSTGRASTKIGKSASKAADVAWETDRKKLLNIEKYEGSAASRLKSNSPVAKAYKSLVDKNGKLLNEEDEFFMSKAYKRHYGKLYEENGVPKLDKQLEELKKGSTEYKKVMRRKNLMLERIRGEAQDEALVATHRQYNKFANALNKWSKMAYDPDSSLLDKSVGFGVNAVMPFAKTPANVLTQMFRYSPAGLLKGTAGVAIAIKNGDMTALNKACDTFASGATGSVILGLGMGLAHFGRINVRAGNNPEDKLKKRQGMQDYSLLVDVGDKQYTLSLDWLAPATSSMFLGANFYNLLAEGIDGEDMNWDNALGVVSQIAEPVLETSMLSGLHDMFEGLSGAKYNNADERNNIEKLLSGVVDNYVSSYIPTAVGQVTRSMYGADLMLTGDTTTEYEINKLKSKAGLGRTDFITDKMGYDTDSYGNIKGKRSLKKAALNLLSPANVQEYKWTGREEKLVKLYKETEDDGVLPNKFYKSEIKVGKTKNGETIKPTSEEKSLYTQARTKGGKDAMAVALEGIMFNRYDKDSKGKKTILREGYTKAEKDEIINRFDGKSTEDVLDWVMDQDYFKKASVNEQKKVIKDILGNGGSEEAKGNRRSGELAVWEHQGKKELDYNFKNELSDKVQSKLSNADDKIKQAAIDYSREALKTSYTENDEGGSSSTNFNKEMGLAWLDSRTDLTEAEKAEIYNAFTTGKDYAYASTHRSGSGSGSGSGSKAKAPTVKNAVKSSAYKRSSGYESLAPKKKSGSKTKPKLKSNVTADMLPQTKK